MWFREAGIDTQINLWKVNSSEKLELHVSEPRENWNDEGGSEVEKEACREQITQ